MYIDTNPTCMWNVHNTTGKHIHIHNCKYFETYYKCTHNSLTDNSAQRCEPSPARAGTGEAQQNAVTFSHVDSLQGDAL